MMYEILLTRIKEKISSWDQKDIYVISLFIYNEEDNPLKPTVTLGYNTEENYKDSIDLAWDEEEARWNYAFWLQNEELKFGVYESELIVQNWIKENNFTIEDDEKITTAFVDVLISIVKELHKSGFIKEKFNKEIPLIIHELEYYEEIANQNIEANSYDLVKDFAKFCR